MRVRRRAQLAPLAFLVLICIALIIYFSIKYVASAACTIGGPARIRCVLEGPASAGAMAADGAPPPRSKRKEGRRLVTPRLGGVVL